MVKIRIKKLHPDAVVPKYASELASGFDLVAVEDVIVKPGATVMVPTGIALEIPLGYELQIRPRSGISRKTKLRISNTPGTIDADYRGEIKILVDNIAPETEYAEDILFGIDGKAVYAINEGAPLPTYLIQKGDRIAQGVIVPVVRAEFEEVEELSETERGAGGFGSTGVRG